VLSEHPDRSGRLLVAHDLQRPRERVPLSLSTDALTAVHTLAMLTGYRATLPRRARGAERGARGRRSWPTGASSRERSCAPSRKAAGSLYVLTADDSSRIAKLTAMDVDGIITNDPRLFAVPSEPLS
jgi:glycerophosphoryl diester phosphodiesterase